MKTKHTVPVYDYNGVTVYGYTGCTYGCCARDETPVTDIAGKYPFNGVPTVDLVEKGRSEPVELDWCD